jgi:hypothetical protein
MMKARRAALPIIVLLTVLALVAPARGQPDDFVVTNADQLTTLAVSASSSLNGLIAGVTSRFVVQYANHIRYYAMTPIAASLQTLLGQVGDRFVIRYANANRLYAFTYPMEMLADVTPPQITGVTVARLDAGSVRISWFTNEFATSRLQYGAQTGTYTHTITDSLYYKLHEVVLTGLVPGTTYYYTIGSTDRSGNPTDSQEYSFTAASPVFLPFVRR